MRRPPPRSTLFPYTTLFRSSERVVEEPGVVDGHVGELPPELQTIAGEAYVGFGDRDRHLETRAELEPREAGPHEIGRATSELQSHVNLVCRLLLEKKKPPTY